MIFKIFISVTSPKDDTTDTMCDVLAVENGERLERRIENKISNLKADGFKRVKLIDVFNISEPTEIK